MLKWPSEGDLLPIEDIMLNIEVLEPSHSTPDVAPRSAAPPTSYSPAERPPGPGDATVSTRDLKAAGLGALVVVVLAGLARWFSRGALPPHSDARGALR